MSYVIITPEQMQTSRWSGGSTTQMMIFPAGSSYRNRDFRFRISSAAVEDAVSVFTKLDGVERFLTVLEGKISLRTGVSEPQELNAYDTIHFHGGAAEGCRKRIFARARICSMRQSRRTACCTAGTQT